MLISKSEAEAIAIRYVETTRRLTGHVSHVFHVDADVSRNGLSLEAHWSVHVDTPPYVIHEHGHEPLHWPADTLFVKVDSATGTASIIPKL